MSQGHMIPMMDIARILAQRGVTVTLSSPHPRMQHVSQQLFSRSIESGSQIRVVPLPFPYKEAGLPDGCENLDTLPSLGTSLSFFNAANTLQEPGRTL
ncbi:putative UDP-glycosyltransferase 73C6-like [Sesbania bispinosa]|nr:putative UDP-glycosyltransferase 73C6-like [Sesbania bispinosa]